MQSVIYLMSGPAHLPYLAVSLLTLREYWDGDVIVYAWPESYGIARRICNDSQIEARCIPRTPAFHGRGSNDQFFDKIHIIKGLPYGDTALYLDADTSIHGRLEQLFDNAELHGFTATQFNDWVANSNLIRNRVRRLEKYPEIDYRLVYRIMTEDHLSLNGGIWSARSDSPVLQVWYDWSVLADGIFIADESVLHLLQLKYDEADFHVMTGGRWNCSPKYQPANLTDDQVVVRHYHGDSCVRPEKSGKGLFLWRTLFQKACRLDVGGIRAWYKTVGNRWLDRCVVEGLLEEE